MTYMWARRSARLMPTRRQNQQRCVRTRLDSAVGVLDVDVGFAEPRGDTRQLARAVRQFHLSHFRLGVNEALVIQNFPGRRRIIYHDTNLAFAFRGEGL